jgi:hypothetical protein
MSFKCQRCGYFTNKIANLKHHYHRKNVCKDINKCGKSYHDLLLDMNDESVYKCPCGDFFDTKQGFHQHKLFCKEGEDPKKVKEMLLEENKRLQEKLENVNQRTEKQYQEESLDNTIIINDFGNENVSYILSDQDFLYDCISNLKYGCGVLKLAKCIYFNNGHLENNTIRIANINLNHVEFKENNTWTRRYMKEPVQEMIVFCRNILYKYYCSTKQNDICMDEIFAYLYNVAIPMTKENKEIFSKMKHLLIENKFNG